MNKLIKITSLLLSLTFLVPCLVTNASALNETNCTEIGTVNTVDVRYSSSAIPIAVEEFETEVTDEFERYGKLILSQMENSENLLRAYELISDGIASLSAKIYLSDHGVTISKNELFTIYDIVINDFPEYFWTGTSYSYGTSYSSSAVSYVIPSYVMSTNDAMTKSEKLNEIVSTIISGVEDKDDYRTAKILHDKLAIRIDYKATDNDQTAYGALVEKQAVCAGYARAYQLVLTRCGIPAWTVSGSSLIPGTTANTSHAWNIVYLDGEWYYTDLTWDDQGDSTENIYYAYFNVTSEQIFTDHAPDADIAPYLPLCTATKNNYFKIKKWECDTFNETIIKNSIKSCGGYSRICYTGDIDKFKTELKASISNIAAGIGITGSFSYSISILGNEIHVAFKNGYSANGDANGDLKVNVKDILLLKKYLAGCEYITEISLKNADMSGDGRLSSLDVMRIRKKLSGN